MRFRLAVSSAALLAAACSPGGIDLFERCDVELSLAPTAAYHGDMITGLGGPFTETYDTFVDVAGSQAEVASVDRIGCNTCDTCRADMGCLDCGVCPDCKEDCQSCSQSITFSVPTNAHVGATSVLVINRYGSSAPVPFTILSQDTGATELTDSATTLDSVPGVHTGDTSAGETGHTGDTAAVTLPGDTGPTVDTGQIVSLHTGDTSRLVETGDTSATATTGP